MSSPAGPAAIGEIVAGRYRIEDWLGQGAMAAVYRATHLGTGQPRALKLVHPQLVERTEIRDLFVQEAHVGARIGRNLHIERPQRRHGTGERDAQHQLNPRVQGGP